VKKHIIDLLKWCFTGGCIGLAIGAAIDYRDTQTMGVGMHDIQAVKAECEKAGAECVMLWDFVKVEADYE